MNEALTSGQETQGLTRTMDLIGVYTVEARPMNPNYPTLEDLALTPSTDEEQSAVANNANRYRVSPAMEKVLNEIRFLIWLADSHHNGIAKIAFSCTKTDGARHDVRETFAPIRKRAK